MQRTTLFTAAALVLALAASAVTQETTTYVRYEYDGNVSYGILEDETIHELRGDIFDAIQRTGNTVAIGSVKSLTTTTPKKVVAVGLNYKSHIGESNPVEYPSLFAK